MLTAVRDDSGASGSDEPLVFDAAGVRRVGFRPGAASALWGRRRAFRNDVCDAIARLSTILIHRHSARSKIRSPQLWSQPQDPDEADGATAVTAVTGDGRPPDSRDVLRIEARGAAINDSRWRVPFRREPRSRPTPAGPGAHVTPDHTRGCSAAWLTHQAYRRRLGLEICRKLDLPGARNFAFRFLCDFRLCHSRGGPHMRSLNPDSD